MAGMFLTTEQFIQKSKEVHGDRYDYSLVEYQSNKVSVIIICPTHGQYIQKPSRHLSGRGCTKCGKAKISKQYRMSNDCFLNKAREIHGNTYEYLDLSYSNNLSQIKILCNEHGEFKQVVSAHLRGSGCPKCKSSKGERKIENWLRQNNVLFETQYKFIDCKNIFLLPFDFYLPEYNVCIEFDGRQHYEVVNRSKNLIKNIENYNKLKVNDKIKDEYCFNNNIHLLRIPYFNIKTIEFILSNYFNLMK